MKIKWLILGIFIATLGGVFLYHFWNPGKDKNYHAIIQQTVQTVRNRLLELKQQYPQLQEYNGEITGETNIFYTYNYQQGSMLGNPPTVIQKNGCQITLTITYPYQRSAIPSQAVTFHKDLPNGEQYDFYFSVKAENTPQGVEFENRVRSIVDQALKEMHSRF